MQSRRTLKFVLGSGVPVEIREVVPSDFLSSGGPPISFLMTKKVMTMHEQVMAGASEEPIDTKKLNEVMRQILSVGVVSYNDAAFDVEEYFQTNNIQDGFEVYIEILRLSLIFFSSLEIQELDKDFADRIDIIAKRYGKTPAQIILGNIEHTDLDAWIVNSSVGIQEYVNDIEVKAKGGVVL